MKERESRYRGWLGGSWFLTLGGWAEALTALLLALACLLVVWLVEVGEWAPPGLSLKATMLLALAAGFLLAHVRASPVILHAISAVLGLSVALWQGAAILPEAGAVAEIQSLGAGLLGWWQAVREGEFTEGTIAFGMLLVLLAWIIGYVASWFVFRKGNGWVVLFLGSAALLVDLSQLPEDRYIWFLLFLAVALGLIFHLAWLKRRRAWEVSGSVGLGRSAVAVASVVLAGVLSLVVAWQVPKVVGSGFGGIINEFAPQWREKSQVLGERLFGGVRPRSSVFSGNETLRLQGTTSLGDGVLFVVGSEEPYFWREKSFDTYTSQGWLQSSVVGRDLPARGSGSETSLAMRAEVFHKVKLKVRTDILLTAGIPLRVSVPYSAGVVPPMSYDIVLSQPLSAASLPEDMASVVRQAEALGKEAVTERAIRELLPPGVEVLSVERKEGQVTGMTLRRKQNEGDDIVSLRARRFFSPEQDYAVLSSVSVAGPASLRSAGEVYPSLVLERYLQLPAQLPARVRTLAREVAGREITSYDRARAIKVYLHQIPYGLSVNAPPRGRDPVDYFLFSSRMGYCEYYASAMTVMLRSLGVPSRLVIGFTPGEWNRGKQLFVVRERNYHAWTEVYFPGYGWIAFDPTPPGGNNNDIAGVNVSDAPQADLAALDADLTSGIGDEGDFGVGTGLDEDGAFEIGGFPFAGSGGWWLGVVIFGMGVGTLLLVFLVRSGYLSFPGVEPSEYARRTYAQMCWIASWGGLRPDASLTPGEYSARLARVLPSQERAIRRISEFYAVARYGPRQQLSQEERREMDS
ncbi:MAG: hypothetical protein HW414_1758, partial [Dehalococcoidia bacterium]|nr:hypothetical protein [Dehalococcoidia bacterium]